MDNKYVSMLILVAFGLIIGFAMISGTGSVADNVGDMTTLFYSAPANITVTADSATTLKGKYVQSVEARNGSAASKVIYPGNFTVKNNVLLSDGTLGATIQLTTIADENFSNGKFQINYTYQPLGYLDDVPSRSIAGLVVVFAALALMVYAALPFLREMSGY